MGRKKSASKHHSEKNNPATPAAAVPDGPRESRREHKEVTRQRINGRFLFISLAIVLVSGLSLHLLHGVQVERNSVSLKERAEAAEEEGDYAKAVGLLAQYLTFREDDHDALLHLVRLRDGLATSVQALANVYLGYEEVLRRDPDRPDKAEIRQDAIAVALTIAAASAPSDAAAAGRYYNLALGHLDTLLDADEFQDFQDEHTDQVAELHYQRGQCYQGLSRFREACIAYLAAIQFVEKELEEGESDKSEWHEVRPRFYRALAGLVLDAGMTEDEFKSLPLATGLPSLGMQKDRSDVADQLLSWTVDDRADDAVNAQAYLDRARYRRVQPRFETTKQDVDGTKSSSAVLAKTETRFEQARQDVEKALALRPNHAETLLFSGQLAMEEARLARLLGRFTTYYGHIERARDAAKRGQELAATDPRFYRLKSEIEDVARQGLALLLPAAAEKPGQTAEHAFEFAKNRVRQAQWERYESAEHALRKGLVAAEASIKEAKVRPPKRTSLRMKDPHPDLNLYHLTVLQNELIWSLADTLITQHVLAAESAKTAESETLAEVREHLSALEKARAERGLTDFLKARLLMIEKDWSDARGLLEKTSLRLAGRSELQNRIYFLLDECYAKMGNPDGRLKVALENKNSFPAILRLPELYRRANRLDEALDEIERIVTGVPAAALEKARLLLQIDSTKPLKDRRFDKVHDVLDSAKVMEVNDQVTLATLRAKAYELEGVQLDALGEVVEAQGKFDAAVAELENARRTWPREPELWAARARLELTLPIPRTRTASQRFAAAQAILERAKEELGDRLPLRLAEVEAATYLPLDEARRKLKDLESSQFSVSDRSRLLNVLAQASLRLSTPDPAEREANQKRALAWLKQAADLQPSDVESQIEWAELARSLSETAPIRTAIDRVTTVEGPSGPNGNYLKALEIFTKAGDVSKLASEDQKRGRELLEHAQKDRPFWAVLERTLGDLEWAAGDEAKAVDHYIRAYNLGDRSGESLQMFSRIAKYYLDSQQPAKADAFLERVALVTPNLMTDELRVDQIQAEALASRNPDGLILLSHLRRLQGKTEKEVLEPLEKASEIAPTTPGTWWALVDYYMKANNEKKAEEVIEVANAKLQEAKQNSMNDGSEQVHHRLPLTLAGCYERTGDRTEAETHYTEAFRVAVENNKELSELQLARARFYARTTAEDPKQRQQDFNSAHEQVDAILDSRTAGISRKREARRFKALLLASTGRYEDTEKALQLIAVNGDDSVEDLLMKVRILRLRNRYRDRLELIEAIEQLENRGFPSAELKLLLAGLYQQADDWLHAEKHYLELLRQNEKNPTVLARYINGLIEQAQLKEAEKRLEEFKLQQPNSITVSVLEAVLEHAKGNVQGAVRLILDAVQNLEEADSPDQAVKDLFLAGKLDEAVDYLEKQAQESNKRDALPAIREVRQLLAQGRSDQAKDLLERQIDTSQLQVLQFKAAAKLVDGWGDLTAAESIIRTTLERSNRPDDVLLLVSNVARQGRIDEALDLCEKAWETCNINRVGAMCVGLLRTNKASPAQMARAEKQLSTAIDEHPENKELKIPLADLRDFQGRYDDAEQVYREILNEDSGNLMALNNLAWLVGMRGKDPMFAASCIEIAVVQAEKLLGPVPELLDTRAVIYLKLMKNRDALKDMEQAINVSKEATPLMYFHLAQAQRAVGDKAAAKKSFEKASSLKAKDFHPLERGNFEEVSKELTSP